MWWVLPKVVRGVGGRPPQASTTLPQERSSRSLGRHRVQVAPYGLDPNTLSRSGVASFRNPILIARSVRAGEQVCGQLSLERPPGALARDQPEPRSGRVLAHKCASTHLQHTGVQAPAGEARHWKELKNLET